MRRKWAILAGGTVYLAAMAAGATSPQPAAPPAKLPAAAVPTPHTMPSTRPIIQDGPTLVTVQFTRADPEAVLAEIRTQTGYNVALYEAARHMTLFKPVTVNMRQQPFWAVVREVCAQADLAPYAYGYAPSGSLMLTTVLNVGSAPMKCPYSLHGPFMVALTGIQRHSAVDMAAPAEVRRTLTLTFTVYAEPRIKVVQCPYYAEIEEAVDASGTSLLGTAPRTPSRPAVAPRAIWFAVTANLPCPAGAPKHIARLRGVVRCLAGAGEASAAEVTIPFSFENVPLP